MGFLFDKNDIEDIGLVKFDFLGLKTLTIIDLAVKAVNKIDNHFYIEFRIFLLYLVLF